MRQIPFYFFINLNPNEIKQSDIKEKNFMMKHNLLDFHFFSNFVDFIKRNIEYKFAVGCSCIQAEAIEPIVGFSISCRDRRTQKSMFVPLGREDPYSLARSTFGHWGV